MNVPAIHYIEFCDRRPVPVCKNVPEFSFSPRVPRVEPIPTFLRVKHPPAPMGPMVPPSISNPRKLHDPLPISETEKNWRNLVPFFKTPVKQTGFVAPMNSLDDIEQFIAKTEELTRIVDRQKRDEMTNRVLIEQDKELPTIVDEFRANGFKAISLSSSRIDDDREDETIPPSMTRHAALSFGPNGMTIDEAAPFMRRIEWERYALQCSVPSVIGLFVNDQGELDAKSSDKRLTADEIREAGRRIAMASGIVTVATLRERHAKAEYYGAIGSGVHGVWRGEHVPEQSMDELGAEDLMAPEENAQGPMELGLHGGVNDPEPIVDNKGKNRKHLKGEKHNFRNVLLGTPMLTLPFDPRDAQEPSESDLWPDVGDYPVSA